MYLMNVTRQSMIRIVVILMMLPLMVLSMNCGGTGALTKDVEATSLQAGIQGGGTGYDGKISFINIDKAGVCGPGPRVQSRIMIDPARGPQLVYSQCRDISPRELSLEEIGLLPHNLKNAIYAGHAYDRYDKDPLTGAAPQSSSEFLCRGSDHDGDLKQTQVADLILRQKDSKSPAEQATVIMALYDRDGKYLKTLKTAELKVRQISTGAKDRVKYVSDYDGVYQITVWIDKSGDRRTAKLTLIELPYPGRQRESAFRDEDYQRNIQNLNCVVH